MNRFVEAYINFVRRVLPSPLTIALLLTFLTLFFVLLFGESSSDEPLSFIGRVWSEGLWQPSLLVFAVQMMLMLVLGHILALSPIVSRLIDIMVKPCTTSAKSAAFVAFCTMIVALFNWGLGLIFGAVMARKVGEKAHREGLDLNYPLIGAAGYAGLMIWHGGFSGSSLIKVAEGGHLAAIMDSTYKEQLPDMISLGETVFSPLNLIVTLSLLIMIPGVLYLIGKRSITSVPELVPHRFEKQDDGTYIGAEKLDHSGIFIKTIGVAMLGYCLYTMVLNTGFLGFFNPNNINLLLLALCLFTHQSITAFSKALDQAISGASGILIQFPLYFGILALMKESGLVSSIAIWFIDVSNASTYPIFTFISAGLVNIFVPSGGGQWAIQGPIIIESTLELGIPLNKSILAMAYGDEITNMLQPFWALPLLGITRLSAKDILPYTLVMFIIGSVVFITGLLAF